MSPVNMMTKLARFFGQDLRGTPSATKSNSANDNAGVQPGVVGKSNLTLRIGDYPMRHESASMKRDAVLLRLLLDFGALRRRDLDKLLDAENTPDIVMRLRRYGEFDIPCERRQLIDGNGVPRVSSWYRLSDTDIPRARAVLQFRARRANFLTATRPHSLLGSAT